ncbi:RelA/SpoT domain-containing protein [Paraburkholderia caribensis]|uniref:RelA/SpoT domain-containing protein n=3 Tax=Paraburkholderia caribensis TaxID=75105 RepID=A0ABV0E7C9_9BURK|nr:RelA/SpoT domain-containing protein [Paraburkholderia caribensis]PTB23515.1 hypothetical protein C9I56_38770 [Paraburkholderia caribensis]
MSIGTYTRYNSIAENLRVKVENLLFNVGILCRVFGRGKSDASVKKKIDDNPGKYSIGGKLIQDAVGLRVAVYFPEDIDVVRQLLCERFSCDEKSSTIDLPSDSTFSVVRYNLIFRVSEDEEHSYGRLFNGQPIDTTFEVQIRTMLSEGWHEVEHDLRYKCKSHWDQQQDLSRTLNGVIATLETAEWSMTRVFDELAYRHYKNSAWAAMLHTKLKMRLPPTISESLLRVLDATPDLGKQLLRIDRTKVMQSLFALETKIPVTIDNVVFLWNYLVIWNVDIFDLTETFLCEQFDRAFSHSVGKKFEKIESIQI